MKCALNIDFDKKLIIMTRLFSQRCRDTSSKEYAQLQSVRRDYPDYTVIVRQIKKNSDKKTYKGLTYAYMEDYILTHEPAETVAAVLNEFEEMQVIAACHSQAFRYPVIKKWFLAKYPEIENFGKAITVDTAVDTAVDTKQSEKVIDLPQQAEAATESA